MGDLVGKGPQEHALDRGPVAVRLLERHARETDGVDDHGLFGEPRDELAAQPGSSEAAGGEDQDGRGDDREAPAK